MEITAEDLKTLYQRAMQYCHAKYGKEPSRLEISETDGLLLAKFYAYNTEDEKYEYINIDNLSENLDDIYAERKKIEEENRIKQEEHNKRLKQIQDKQDKVRREELYLRLKREFEK